MESQDPKNLPNLDQSKTKEDKNQSPLEESKANPSSDSIIENTPPKLLAWCSFYNNKISIRNLETNQEFADFDGAKMSNKYYSWTHVKELPNTNLLVSLYHTPRISANMRIFDISKKGKAKNIYSLAEVFGVVGLGDVTYNVRRNILGAISLNRQITYHLFSICASASNVNEIVKLNRKSRWHPQCSDINGNVITGFDFNPSGESVATIDRFGVCLISDVNTARYIIHLDMGKEGNDRVCERCRWSSNTGEHLLYVKYSSNQLNIMDAEKKILTLTNPVKLDSDLKTYWIDVCQRDGNLLASGGFDKNVKIFDKRQSKIVKTFDSIHSSFIRCVRWSPSGDMLASASDDKTVKLLDFKTGKAIHTGNTSDGNPAYSVCFI